MLPFVLSIKYQKELAVVYAGVQSPREGEIGFCNLMAFGQEKDYEAAGENKIFISLVCSNIQMFRWLLIRGSSGSAPRYFNCAEYILNRQDYTNLW